MALKFNSTEIPNSGIVKYNSTALDVVKFGTVEVWKRGLNLLEPSVSNTWKAGGKLDSNLGTGTLGTDQYPIIQDSSPYLQSTGETKYGNGYCYVITKNAIDFSKYSNLKIVGTFHGDNQSTDVGANTTRACCAFGFSTNNSVSVTFDSIYGIMGFGSTFDGGAQIFNASSKITGTDDDGYSLSNFTGKYYIKLLIARAGLSPYGSFKVTKLILE